jgi:hypothetical protein
MLTVEDPSVVVPPIPAPRKNKRIIHGKLNILDLFIIIPAIVILLVIIFTCKLAVWELVIVGIVIIIIAGFLCWPMGFLGKDKPYIFVLRGMKFFLGSRRNLVSETNDIANTKSKVESKTSDDKVVKKSNQSEQVAVSKFVDNEPKDFLSRVFKKKNKK